jgi:hypothetical protein
MRFNAKRGSEQLLLHLWRRLFHPLRLPPHPPLRQRRLLSHRLLLPRRSSHLQSLLSRLLHRLLRLRLLLSRPRQPLRLSSHLPLPLRRPRRLLPRPPRPLRLLVRLRSLLQLPLIRRDWQQVLGNIQQRLLQRPLRCLRLSTRLRSLSANLLLTPRHLLQPPVRLRNLRAHLIQSPLCPFRLPRAGLHGSLSRLPPR